MSPRPPRSWRAPSCCCASAISPPGTPSGDADLALTRPGQTVIAFLDPLGEPALAAALASRGVTALSMELMPRITRAQSMDALSSMATVAGYKAVLLAASHLPRMFPMLTTAAGTIKPARVFVVGAGVAGLQAISTARRLGAPVEAYDVRPAAKEQVQSVGAKFVELPLEAGDAEDKGGYAKAQDESFYRRQREMMAKVVAGKRRRHHHRGDPRQALARAGHRGDGEAAWRRVRWSSIWRPSVAATAS